MTTDKTKNKSDAYVAFIGGLIDAGDTILVFVLPIWIGIAYGDGVVKGVFVAIVSFILFTVPFLPFTYLFKLFWHIVGFVFLLPINLKRLFGND